MGENEEKAVCEDVIVDVTVAHKELILDALLLVEAEELAETLFEGVLCVEGEDLAETLFEGVILVEGEGITETLFEGVAVK